MILKHTASSISHVLCSLFNLSLATDRIPDAWKLSRIVPEFKAGDPHEVSNYLPISLQSICGKLLEKIIHRNILCHLNTPGGGALTLERGMGMCRGHDPFFSGQSPLPSPPIYRQCAALVPPVFNF